MTILARQMLIRNANWPQIEAPQTEKARLDTDWNKVVMSIKGGGGGGGGESHVKCI